MSNSEKIENNSIKFYVSNSNNTKAEISITKRDKRYLLSSSSNMIPCADCHRNISVHTSQCIFCGCPIDYSAEFYFKKYTKIELEKAENEHRKELIESLKKYADYYLTVYSIKRIELNNYIPLKKEDFVSLENKSTNQLEVLEKRRKTENLICSCSNEFIRYSGYNYGDFEIAALDTDLYFIIKNESREFEKKHQKIYEKVSKKAETYYYSRREMITQKLADQRKANDENVNREEYKKLQIGEKICKKCGKVFKFKEQSDIVCAECKKYEGLENITEHIGYNTGGFNKNASLMGLVSIQFEKYKKINKECGYRQFDDNNDWEHDYYHYDTSKPHIFEYNDEIDQMIIRHCKVKLLDYQTKYKNTSIALDRKKILVRILVLSYLLKDNLTLEASITDYLLLNK